MNSERTIIKKWKFHVYGFLVLLFVQAMAIPLLNAFLKEFIGQSSFRKVALLIILAICISVDLYFLLNRVILLRHLLNKAPVKCRLEDIFLIGYKDDKRTRYAPFLIVRSIENQKLYLAYDKYSLLNYTATFNYSDKKNIRCTVYKGDGIPVRLGDIVDMYILRTVKIPVSIDQSKNTVKLKRRKIYFRHMNEQINIDVFENITFFKGAIDLDTGIL